MSIQRFSSLPKTRTHRCPVTDFLDFDERSSTKWCIGDTTITKLWKNSTLKCFIMFLYNLADPGWASVHCHQQLLTQLICIKDISQKNDTINKNTRFVQKEYICASNAILVKHECYEFTWVLNIASQEYATKTTNTDIMTFKNIFEAIAVESKYLTAFVKKNISVLDTVTFIRNLDTVIFERGIAENGYLIYPSKKYLINLGSNVFKCSKGINILFEYVCDGTLDCLYDASDEDICACNSSSHTKQCKTVISMNVLTTCSSVYYMTKNGHCLKYTDPKNIYENLNITKVSVKYKLMVTSKLTALGDYEQYLGYKYTGNNNVSFSMQLKKHDRCLVPGDLDCVEMNKKCFNVTSMCIYMLNFNNSLTPCKNGRHLEHCKTLKCDSLFKCIFAYCIPWSYVCNGQWDCPRGNDELICNEKKIVKICSIAKILHRCACI